MDNYQVWAYVKIHKSDRLAAWAMDASSTPLTRFGVIPRGRRDNRTYCYLSFYRNISKENAELAMRNKLIKFFPRSTIVDVSVQNLIEDD